MLKLFTLGTLDLRRSNDGGVYRVVLQRKRTALLVYLAAGAGEIRSRDTLLGMFWPELGESAARRALNQALYALRAAAGEQVIESSGAYGVLVRPEKLWCDAVAFDHSMRSGSVADALALYSGDFAPGLFVSRCLEFDRWLEASRHTLRLQAAQGAATLSAVAALAGRRREAIDWARRQLSLAPHDESAVRMIVTQLASLGDRAEATETYGLFAKQLHDDLGLDPSRETKRIAREISSEEFVAGVASDRETRRAPTPPPQNQTQPQKRSWSHMRMIGAVTLTAAIVGAFITVLPRAWEGGRSASRSNAEYLSTLAQRFSTKRTPRDLEMAVELFRRATKEDRNYAPAYGGLAESYVLLAWYDTLSPAVAGRRVRDVAATGLRLDAHLASAHASLGASSGWLDGNWREALSQFRQAIELDSTDATTHQWHGLALASAGRLESARTELAIAARCDPGSAGVATDFATVLFWSHEYTAAGAQIERALALDSDFRPAVTRLWRFYAATGDFKSAFEALERTARAEGATTSQTQEMRRAYTQDGWRAALSVRARMLQEISDARPTRALQLATILSLLGRDEEALQWLERVRDAHSVYLRFVPLDPAFSHLANDKHFREIVAPGA